MEVVIHTNNRFDVVQLIKKGKKYIYVSKPESVGIVLTDSNNNIIMLKQKRVTQDTDSLELPGGRIKISETPLEAAKRELYEETGYQAESARHLLTLYSSPGYSSEKVYIFFVRSSSPIDSFTPTKPDEVDVEILRIKVDQLNEYISNGTINGGIEVAALQYWFYNEYRRNHK